MWQGMLELGLVYLSALAIPGPSVMLVIRNGIVFSRVSSLLASMGVVVGIAFQSAAALISILALSQHPTLFRTLQILCSLYVIYLGYQSLRVHSVSVVEKREYSKNKNQGFFAGFFIEILNPFALCFFISVLSHFVLSTYPKSISIKLLYWLEIVVVGAIWFCGIALLFSSEIVSKKLERSKKQVEVIAGLIFIVFGIKSLMSMFN